MEKTHHYQLHLAWTGNLGQGTAHYRGYARDHAIAGQGKAASLPCSSDPAFRGDPARYSPEELLVASLSSCHMLWLLHLCADAGIVVVEYTDEPAGEMRENADGSGEFTAVTLRPRVVITDAARAPEIEALHERAHDLCFIARSVNFPVRAEPVVAVYGSGSPEDGSASSSGSGSTSKDGTSSCGGKVAGTATSSQRE
jgi:organic hydroperoxide reductase OsmC/OhrA